MTDLPNHVRWQLWIVAFGFFMQALDTTIVNTALPSMAKSLGESPLHMHMVIVSYVLTVAVMLPASGWLADKVGVRNIFCTAIILFTLGSLFCALSGTLNELVMARVLQGVGGAMMVPVGRLTVMKIVPREQYMAAMTFVTLPGQVGPLLGPALGGVLVEYASWHWIFLINLPVGVIGCIAALRFMPDLKGPERVRFDTLGFVLFGVAMVLITIALEGLGEMHMPHARVTLLLFGGAACMAAYWLRAGRIEAPLFSPKLFHTRSFAVGIFGNLFARLGGGALPFLVPLLLQVALGYSPAQAGMSMIPLALGAMAVKSLAKPIIDRLGYRRLLIGNTLLLGCLIASLATIGTQTPTWLLLVHLGLIGMVNSMQFTAMNTVTLIGLSHADASSGNSLLSVVVQLSMSLGVATAGALLGGFTVEGAAGSEVLHAFQLTFLCVGAMAMLAAALFLQLDHRDPGHDDDSRRAVDVGE